MMRRSRIEMIWAVLRAIQDSGRGQFYGKTPVAKCRMARSVGLNIQFFTDTVNFLVKQRLLVEDTTGKRVSFNLTDKGGKWLKNFRECQDAIVNIPSV